MDPLPIAYLHLETVVIPLFLAMVLLVQLARSTEEPHFIAASRRQYIWVMCCFLALCLVCSGLLANVSLLLAAELAAGITLSLLHPVNALCFFIHLLFLRPWEIATENPLLLALPRMGALLCVFSWLIHPAIRVTPSRRTLKGLILLSVFSVWLFLTTFVTPDMAETQSKYFETYFKAFVIFGLCAFFIDNPRSLSQFTLTLVISALALMVVRFYQYRTEGPSLIRLESGGMFGDPNDLAGVVVLSLPFALVPVFRKGASGVKRALGLCFAAFSTLVIWYSQSRGAMLALVAQGLTTGLFMQIRRKGFILFVLGVILGGGYLIALRSISREAQEMQESSDSRIMYWKAAARMTLHHPLLGVGFGHYGDTYGGYSSEERYEWGKRTAHSSWFLIFAESGVPGGVLFVSFAFFVLKTAWRNRDLWPDQLISIVGYGVVMSFLSHTYIFYFYLLAGLVLASESLRERLAHGT